MKKVLTKMCALACMSAAASVLLVGCGSGDSGTVTVEGDVPLAYAKRSTALSMNPTDGAPSAAGGDLMLREKSSPSAPEHNITASITKGVGDASDPEVSYDGKKIVFALRCPTSNNTGGSTSCTGRWNIWEYDMTSGGMTGGSLRRLTSSSTDDDADPAYLPAGAGFVFSSNRQATARVNQALGQNYKALDEYEREAVMNLHTMDANGGDIKQISFNQSHDRNPVVLHTGPDLGKILFSRWEHVGDRNRFAMFTVKPDGTSMFVYYGAQSPGNSFLHPREMDPNGPYTGQLASSLMPLSRTQEGGALMFVNATDYSENNTPASTSVPAQGGQRSVTAQALNQGQGLSEFGRVTTPFPLWDGTNRVLLAYRPCEVMKNGVATLCANLTAEEKARLNNRDRMAAEVAADSVRDNAPANYAIYMFNPANQTQQIVAAPPPGFMYTDPVPLQARGEPPVIQTVSMDAEMLAMVAANVGTLEVRSIYDTDGLGRMGEGMLVARDRPAGCSVGIAMTAASNEPSETRQQVADLLRLKDPADPAYRCSPARMVRVTRAVAPPQGMTGLRSSIGETDFEQQQILGYAPIEPDGSFKMRVPADTPIALSVIDDKGRAIQTHTNWIQVRPGERRTCDGCHSPRRGASLNNPSVTNVLPAALVASLRNAHLTGETMASTRTRVTPALLDLLADIDFTDVWAADPAQARSALQVSYTGNPNAADDLVTTAPATSGTHRGIINYPEHIQPLWIRSRGVAGAQTCVTCHAAGAGLDLRGTTSGTGRVTSYEEVILGDPVIDTETGLPQIRLEDGVPMVERGPALVETSSSAMRSAGQARKSRLTEILFGETLLAGAGALAAHPAPALDHSTMLNAAEKRLLVEWMDLGGQYYNDPFNPNGSVRSFDGLSETVFETQVHPILRATCAASCHMAIGSDQTTPAGTQFRENRFVLTGSAEGDFGTTLSMISDTCNAASNYLLSRPSTVPHPAGATGQVAAVLPAGSAAYNTIAAWIATGCR